MIAELGHYALVLAFAIALVQSTLPLWGAHRRDAALIGLAPAAATAQFACLCVALGALTNAYVTSDFSLANVAANSHSAKPMIYKISGVWGNHEGSLLLWVWILGLFGGLIAWLGSNLPGAFKARTLAVQGMIGAGFLAFTLFTSNPFERLIPAPLDGNGLNPVLQDPGLALHPPMLYLGYVGLSTAFSFAMAALIEGRVDPTWARWLRPWTLGAWMALTLGIALGSWWAYYELGWGGFWFWDPVENASFMPWLAATALLHSAIVVEKRDTLKTWTVLLAILAFSLSLLGTFLVRSGVLTSVHAFANDPSRGVFILALLVIAIGGSLALFAYRAPAMQGGGVFAPISREGGLLLNNLLLATATATVLLGTLYPLFMDVLGLSKISVGPPFYNATFVPLSLPLLVAVPIGTALAWKRGDLSAAMQRLWAAAALSLGVFALVWAFVDLRGLLSALGFLVAIWLVLGSLGELAAKVQLGKIPFGRSFKRLAGLPGSTLATAVAHAGLGILIAGVTSVSTGQTERILVMREGDTTEIAGYEVAFGGVREVPGPNYVALRGDFEITRNGGEVASLFSERRFFPVEGMPTTEAGIDTGLLRDLYVVLGDQAGAAEGAEVDPSEVGWTVRLYHNPLAFWIWLGAGIMAFGGMLSLMDRRLRVGAPVSSGARVAAAGAGSAKRGGRLAGQNP